MSHRKYKTLEENKTLFLLVLKGKKRWPLPFQKPKNWAAERRTSSKRWGRKWHKTAAARETYRISWGYNQSSCIVVRWEPVNFRRNKPKSVWSLILWTTSLLPKPHFIRVRGTPSSHHRCGHTCDIEGDTLHCPKKRQAPLQRLFSSTSLGHHSLKWKIRQQCNGLLTTLAEKVGIFYAKEDTRYPKQILRLANLSFNRGCSL